MNTCGTAAPSGGSDNSGFSYVVVLMTVTVITVLGLSFLSKAGIGTSAILQRNSAIQAEYLAEAAANHAMWKLLNDPLFPAAEDIYYMHSLGGGRYGYMVRRHTDSTFATVAAVGAVEKSVVKRCYVLHPTTSSGPSQMITGTYVGDGADNRSITGVGFQPDVIIVKGDLTGGALIRTSTMTGDKTKRMTGGAAVVANGIQSLDSDGFTIGSSNDVNGSGIDYYWAAFKAVEGEMKLGTYTGDGSNNRDITGVGFSPSLVFVFAESNIEMVHRSDYSVNTFDFNKGGSESDRCIKSPFLSDGFRVGRDNRVNKSGHTFHYICWLDIGGQQKFSGYTGDNTDDRDITGLGFTPEYVIVRCVSFGQHMVHRMASLGGTGESMFFSPMINQGDRIQTVLADGFQVGGDNDVNANEEYAYFAWAKK